MIPLRKFFPFFFFMVSGACFSEQAEVLMLPLTNGPLASIAQQLTLKMQEELLKSGIIVNFVPRSMKLPLSIEDKTALIKNALNQKLPFLLIQEPDSKEPGTLRHDLIRTFDSKPLISVLVKTDNSTGAILKSVLLAKEIQAQLKALPPEIRNPVISKPEIDTIVPKPTIIEDEKESNLILEGSFLPYWPVGLGADYLQPSFGFSLKGLWTLIPGTWELSIGPMATFLWQEAKGVTINVPLFLSCLEADLRLEWHLNSYFSIMSEFQLGLSLLSFEVPVEGLKHKLLPSLGGGGGVIVSLPLNFQVHSFYRLSGIIDPGIPLLFHEVAFGIGYKL